MNVCDNESESDNDDSILSGVVGDFALFQLRKSIFSGTDEISDIVFRNFLGAKQEDGLNLSFLCKSCSITKLQFR